MNYIKAPFVFILWLLYVLITAESRDRYMAGKTKGYHCYKANTNLNSTEYCFDRNEKPYKEYLTWKDFWSKFGYYKQTN